MPAREIPVIVGVGDIKNRSTKVEDAREPAQLMLDAIQSALEDTGLQDTACLREHIDSIDVVRTWTWLYPDLPSLLAERLTVNPKHKFYSEHGGNQPGKLFDDAARRIARGETKVAVLTGGEALASLSTFVAAKKMPPPGWVKPAEPVHEVFKASGRVVKATENVFESLGQIHEIGAPIHVYPLYENAFRAHRGQSLSDNHAESARLYANFSAIASQHPYAWNYDRKDDEERIGMVNERNRMICFPYPLLMNAFNSVNLASAVILISESFAKSIDIPQDKWVYPLGGAGTSDCAYFWERPNFYTSPSISRSLDAALDLSGLSCRDLDLIDVYSCFPIVPKLAAHHLGLNFIDREKPLTVLGGLTSFGGAGNNYSMHALTEMTRKIRAGQGKYGLVLCNGGLLSYQHVIVLGKESKSKGLYAAENPLPAMLDDVEKPDIALEAEGEAVIETYTVEFNRNGSPLRGYVVGRLKDNGKRFLANHGDEATLRQMASGVSEMVGKSGWVQPDSRKKGRGLFTLNKVAKI